MRTKFWQSGINILLFPVQMRIMEIPHGILEISIYQVENAMLVRWRLRFCLAPKGILTGWRKALPRAAPRRAGRMEEIFPDFYIDGANNTSAVEGFARVPKTEKKITCFLPYRRKRMKK